tara:strand:+ start:13750 stop:14067 length:318 start_codon:yes stop_codon:yes gene_type:complete
MNNEKTISPFKVAPLEIKTPAGPQAIKRPMEWVRSEHLLDFIDPEKKEKIINMPYWILTSSGALWFEFVRKETEKEELLQLIRAKVIYIRPCDARSKATQENLNQ